MKQPLPQRKGFGAGMNMLAPDYALPDGAVRDATNLDVTTEGVLRTRQGYASAPRVSGTRCHSLFANSAFMLHADGAALKRTTASGTETVAAVQNAEPISYAQLPSGNLAWSDGSSIGQVGPSGASYGLALVSPGAPLLAAVSNGTLKAGRYLVAVTWVAYSGEESPPSLPVDVTITEGQGISLSGIPQTPPTGAIGLRVYCSHTNESVLFEAAFVGAGTTSLRIDSPPTGRQLETLFEANFPPCSALAFAAGRLLGFRGNMFVWSEPFRPGVWRPSQNFLQLSQPGSLIAPTQDGVYVGTLGKDGQGEVVFLAGFDYTKSAYLPVTPYGAYPGTLVDMPHTMQMGWASPQGFVIADNGGQVTNISFDKVAFPAALRGGSMVREENGIRQIVTGLAVNGVANGMTAADYFDAEIIKGASNG